jgi:hypothetical protein
MFTILQGILQSVGTPAPQAVIGNISDVINILDVIDSLVYTL